jgi:S-adenosylmethionine hydrolase
MKGVILSTAPHARVVDLTHDVPPQAIVRGAFLLETAWRFFAAGTVHVAVVDPGVGSSRRRVVFAVDGHFFIGPDNGVLSGGLPDSARGLRGLDEDYDARPVELPPGLSAVVVENEALFRRPVSATFEGRDVFAPVAAHLARGGPLDDLGRRITALQAFPAFRAPSRDGSLAGIVLHEDRFGNLITDIRAADLPHDAVFVAGGVRLRLSSTYAASTGLSAIVSSAGFVEIAMANGSASRVLGLAQGDTVRVTSADRTR